MDEIPTLPQFLKWLALALLAGLVLCGTTTAFARAYGDIPFWGEILGYAALASCALVLGSNAFTLLTITFFWNSPDVEPLQAHARASLFLTTAQTIIVVALCTSCGCGLSAFIALAAVITMIFIILFAPGSLLPPLPR